MHLWVPVILISPSGTKRCGSFWLQSSQSSRAAHSHVHWKPQASVPGLGLSLCSCHRAVSFRNPLKARSRQVERWASFHHKPGSTPPTEQLGFDKSLFLCNDCFVGKFPTSCIVAFYSIFFPYGHYKSVANWLHSYTEDCECSIRELYHEGSYRYVVYYIIKIIVYVPLTAEIRSE